MITRWWYNYIMAVNGKAKGSSFERKIANLLSERFEAKLGIKNGFRRNPDSGSFFGGSNKSRTESYSLDFAIFGDLICPRDFRYSVECKHYKTPPSLQSMINHKVTQWDGWLAQAKQDAENSKRLMVLVVKYNNVDPVAFLEDPLPGMFHTRYQGYYVHTMEQWLSQSDDHFFDVSEAILTGHAAISNANDSRLNTVSEGGC